MKIEPLLVSPKEAARMIGLSESTIHEMLSDGELTRLKRGRNTLIEVKEIEAWVEELKLRQSA